MATKTPLLCLTKPTAVDICVYRGDSGRLKLTVTAAGLPYDVTGAAWDADIRASVDDPTVIAQFTITPVVGDPSSVYLDLPALESAKLTANAVYDVQMTLAGSVQTIVAGKVVLTKDVSRV